MTHRFFKSLYIFLILIAGSSCSLNGKDPVPKTEGENRFGKVSLQFSDSTSPANRQLIHRLDTFYNRQIAAGFNGSVLVGYKGKVMYERYFGVSQRETGELWNEKTQSQLASTSKTLTSGAILLLKDKGLLEFDDKVQKYIPSFPYSDITIRMLLNHRSGLPDYIKFIPKPVGKDFLNNDDVVNYFAQKKPKLNFTPNTRFLYSNSNFAFLASVVESVSGMKFDYFMKRFIFTPIGMDCTFVFNPEKDRECTRSFCYNYRWVLEPDMHYDGVWGDKGVYSSVRDLYKWDQALYSGKLIKKSTLEEAFKPYSFESEGIKNYGLGWRMINYTDGVKIIYHNGWWHGNNTCFYRFIQDNFTIIILGNRFNKGIYRQPQQIYNIVMGLADTNSNLDDDE